MVPTKLPIVDTLTIAGTPIRHLKSTALELVNEMNRVSAKEKIVCALAINFIAKKKGITLESLNIPIAAAIAITKISLDYHNSLVRNF
jgi:hypothetical protein